MAASGRDPFADDAAGLDPDIEALLGGSGNQARPAPRPAPGPAPSASRQPERDSFDEEPDYGHLLDDIDSESAATAPAAPARPAGPAGGSRPPATSGGGASGEDAYILPAQHNLKYKLEIDFEPKGFIRRAVEDEDPQVVQQLAKMKKLFDQPPDKKDKFMYREKMTSSYWNLVTGVIGKLGSRMTLEKRLLLRYGLLDGLYLRPEQVEMIKMIPMKKTMEEPILYLDEWLRHIAEGKIKQSMVDEIKKKKAPSAKDQEKLERKLGARDAELSNLRSKLDQAEMEEDSLRNSVEVLTARDMHPLYEGYKEGYAKNQKDSLNEILQHIRKLALLAKDIDTQYNILGRLEEEIEKLKGEIPEEEAEQDVDLDTEVMREEFNSIRQMVKMCVGRQGNHFPVLYAPYVTSEVSKIATREAILAEIKSIEKLDPGLFVREYKREKHRIFPYIILMPGYGDYGICWEPYDKYNKASSRGRIAMCLFPKSMRYAVLTALADLRWQVAKETAQHYWMEEGLTGKYYGYYSDNRLKGDIKMHFIKDYTLWITQESQGIQRIEQGARAVLWRYCPFPQPLKDILKNRGYYFNELYKRDENIARSDGY